MFGGDFTFQSTFGDAPADMEVPDSEKGKVMHVSLPIGGTVLMGSDNCEGFGPPRTTGSNFAISYSAASKADADRVFAALLAGGNVSTPMQDTFWGSYFGQGTDKYGIEWMVNVDQPQED